MTIKYTKEFLVSELLRFVKENGKSPRYKDMSPKYGYPAAGAYVGRFGSFNNALKKAGLKINQIGNRLTGFEVCDNCGNLKRTNHDWQYKHNQRLCPSCYNNVAYKYGNLDPKSATGFAFLSQRIVAKTLGLKLKYDCNCSEGFGSEYDLYDKKLGYINVKTAILGVNNFWQFNLGSKYTPDTYIMLGFASDKSDILHVWVTDALDDLTYEKKGISITNKYLSGIRSGLKRAEPWEVDVKSYNDAYHSMSLDNCSILKSD